MIFNYLKSFSFIVVLTILFFCTPLFSRNHVQAGFVTRDGQNLYLDGKPYRFIGVNRYNLATTGGSPYVGCGAAFTNDELVQYFDELQDLGVNAIRFWAFQNFTQGGTYFDRIDYILTLASQHDMKVIPVLENNWAECTQGGNKSNLWYANAALVTPRYLYGYPLTYREYVDLIVDRYKNNDTILAWQLMNEAESKTYPAPHTAEPGSLYTFAENVSNQVRIIDSNHLISLGTMGGNQLGIDTPFYIPLYTLPNINFIEYTDFNFDLTPLPTYLRQRFTDRITLQKPIFVPEVGIASDTYVADPYDLDHDGNLHRNCNDDQSVFLCWVFGDRSWLYHAKFNAFFDLNGVGWMIWNYRDANGTNPNIHDFSFTEQWAQSLRYKATRLKQLYFDQVNTFEAAYPDPQPPLRLYHLTGQLMSSTDWYASPWYHSANFLTYGPYVSNLIANGSYKASWRLLVDNNDSDNNDVVKIEVFDATTSQVLVDRTIKRTEFLMPNVYQYFWLDFNYPAGHLIETRTYWFGSVYTVIDKVILSKTDLVNPVVDLNTPIDNAQLTRGVSYNLSATATDTNLKFVEFLLDNTIVCEDKTLPFNCDWTIPQNTSTGTHSLTVKAFDHYHNNSSHSHSISIQ